jgi:hypothetical protein
MSEAGRSNEEQTHGYEPFMHVHVLCHWNSLAIALVESADCSQLLVLSPILG